MGSNGEGASISNTYAVSTVVGRDNVGGLVGSNGEGASISNTYAVSTVKGRDNVGGLVGFNGGGEGDIVNSYYTYTGQESSWGERRTSEELACPTAPDAMSSETCPLPADTVTYVGWSGSVWNFGTANELPTLRSGGGGDPDSSAMSLRVRVYLGGAVR